MLTYTLCLTVTNIERERERERVRGMEGEERGRERIVSYDFKTVISEEFRFTVDCICFSGYILDANN
jgi:hypothetical protein